MSYNCNLKKMRKETLYKRSMTDFNHIMCGVSFNFMQNKDEEYLYFGKKNIFYHRNFGNLSYVEYNDKYVNLCLSSSVS